MEEYKHSQKSNRISKSQLTTFICRIRVSHSSKRTSFRTLWMMTHSEIKIMYSGLEALLMRTDMINYLKISNPRWWLWTMIWARSIRTLLERPSAKSARLTSTRPIRINSLNSWEEKRISTLRATIKMDTINRVRPISTKRRNLGRYREPIMMSF